MRRARSFAEDQQPEAQRAGEVGAHIHERAWSDVWLDLPAVQRPANRAQQERRADHAEQPRWKERAIDRKDRVTAREHRQRRQQRDPCAKGRARAASDAGH